MSVTSCYLNVTSPNDFRTKWMTDPNQECLIYSIAETGKGQASLGSIRNLFRNLYNTVQGPLLPTGQETDIQNYLYDICLRNPALCRGALDSSCKGYSRASAEQNGNILRFCGCFMDDSVYSKYIDTYNSSKLCDPLCSNGFSIQETDLQGDVTPCPQNICIIDEITITIISSQVGDISFDQVCSGCTGLCTCNITNVDVEVLDSALGGIQLEQNCSGLNCYEENDAGDIVAVPCDGSGGTPKTLVSYARSALMYFSYIAFALLLILALSR